MTRASRSNKGSDNLSRYLAWRLEKERISRRQLLRGASVAGLGAAGLALVGCGDDDDDGEAVAPPPESPPESPPAPSALGQFELSGAAQGESLDVLVAAHTGFFRLVGESFEQQTGADLNFQIEAFGLLPTIYTPAFEAGGHSWDVVYLWRAWVEQFREFLMPLDELGLEVDSSDFNQEGLEASRALDGKFYGLPSNVYTYVLYGNRKRLEEVGVTELPTTYSDFVDLSRELSGNGKLGYTDGWAPLYLQPKWNVWLHLNGGILYSDGEVGDVLFDTPQAMQATQDMIDLLPYMPVESPTSPWGIYDVEAKKLFFDETAAMIIDYQHIWYEAQDPELSLVGEGNVMVGLIPGGKAGGPASAGQSVGECWAIPRTSQKKEAALDLVKFLSHPDQQVGLFTRRPEIAAFDLGDESGYPSYKSLYSDPRVPAVDQPNIDVALEQQKFPKARYGTRPAYQAIADTIEAAVSSALLGEKDVEDAHREAQSALDQLVDEEVL